MPPVGEFLEILSDSGCKLRTCKLAVDMFYLKEEDLIDDLDGILTIGDFTIEPMKKFYSFFLFKRHKL